MAVDNNYQRAAHQNALAAMDHGKLATLCALLLHRATIDLMAADTPATLSVSLQTYYTQMSGATWVAP